jgi:hypothetical protein
MGIKENDIEVKLNNGDINMLNDIVGSLLIKQFNDYEGFGQEHYRSTITTIMTDFFKSHNSSVKIYK